MAPGDVTGRRLRVRARGAPGDAAVLRGHVIARLGGGRSAAAGRHLSRAHGEVDVGGCRERPVRVDVVRACGCRRAQKWTALCLSPRSRPRRDAWAKSVFLFRAGECMAREGTSHRRSGRAVMLMGPQRSFAGSRPAGRQAGPGRGRPALSTAYAHNPRVTGRVSAVLAKLGYRKRKRGAEPRSDYYERRADPGAGPPACRPASIETLSLEPVAPSQGDCS